MRVRRLAWIFVGLASCGAPGGGRAPVVAAPAASAPEPPATPPPPPARSSPGDANAEIALRFEQLAERHRDLDYAGLLRETGARRAPEKTLAFDPRTARYYDRVRRELQLTAEEQDKLHRLGLVSVDHVQAYSMGSLYYAIYARDLPVLITTDSVLHALHRSYDEVLKRLELGLFTRTIDDVLTKSHDQIGTRFAAEKNPELRTALADVDLYVTVGRNLLAGAGVSDRGAPLPYGTESWDGALRVASRAGQDAQALKLLERVASLEMETPDTPTRIWGGRRPVDWSQFEPRAHYADVLELRRYFRTLMWLGRADLGWHLSEPDPRSLLKVDVERERRAAAAFTWALKSAGKLGRLQTMSDVIDFMVGRSDSVTAAALFAALERAKLGEIAALADPAALERAVAELRRGGLRVQQIRSQTLASPLGSARQTELPVVFQVFGQRFLIDSFVLSKVVYDSIVFHGEKRTRMMPSGLDVMAALGSDEAIHLLKPELEQHRYAANLLAARRVLEERTPQAWRASLYDRWVDALRALDDVPSGGPHVPSVMRSRAWAHKQLQTAHASWAELRHDTLLYGKQSYSAYPSCEYPDAYVEPYPEFFAKLGALATEASRRLGLVDVSDPDPAQVARASSDRDAQVAFFRGFSQVMQRLEALARKQLRAEPFTDAERQFLKQTIDIRGGGSGPPRYDGWYPKLIYSNPASLTPTVADVHTSQAWDAPPEVLEVGVGTAQFLVVAIDNESDRAIYVGPAYSYYEFRRPPSQRMTDQEWWALVRGNKLPERPAWTRDFSARPLPRHLNRPRAPR